MASLLAHGATFVTTEDGKNAAAVALGRMGGKARAAGLSPKTRQEIVKMGAKTALEQRWLKNRNQKRNHFDAPV
jgi:hypothetical protein